MTQTQTAINIPALERRLSKAKTSLILEHPFLGSLALNMPFIVTDQVKTAATNGKYVKFNPDFIAPLCDEQLKFLVAHEIFHPVFEHNYRRGNRDPKKWNVAGDYVINQILSDEGIGKFIEGGCLNKSLYDAGDGMTDKIYNLLPDMDDGDDSGSDGSGTAYDDCEDADGGEAEREQAASEMRVKVAQAAQAARMQGKLSAGLERLIGEVLQPKIDWRSVLWQFMTKQVNNRRTYARPNRRFMSRGLYLPSTSGEGLGEIAFAVDCSGSISAEQIAQAAGEIGAVFDELQPKALHVLYFDSEVAHVETYKPGDTLDIRPHGGGGTAFSPVFHKIEELGEEIVACIFLTDLYCSDFGAAPDYPVLWISDGAQDAPFGEVVKW